jgi:hypothetical protein
VPLITTTAPTAPPVGVKPVSVGVGNTVKLGTLCTVTPLLVTEILPVDVPDGTTATMEDEEDDVTVADTPLKDTTGDGPKLLPLIVTLAPAAALVGVKLEMLGVGSTVKLVPLLIVTPFTCIEIAPVLAPAGTVVAILDVVDEVIVAGVPLNDTIGVVLKFVPEMLTIAPTAPLVGENSTIVGVESTVKFDPLVILTPFTNMEMGPVNAPPGTTVLMVVALKEFTIAATPLKDTVGVVLKLVPVIVTNAPTAPLVGEKEVSVGVERTVKLSVL